MFVTMELDKGNSSSGYVTYTGNYEQLLINTDYIQRINIRARELFLVIGNTSWKYKIKNIDDVLSKLK